MGFLTTSNPKLWFGLLAGLFAFCCCGGSCLAWIGGLAAQEVAWFAQAQRSVRLAAIPPPEEMALIRRLQGGEAPSPQLIDGLAKAAGNMANRTDQAAAELRRVSVPERLAPMNRIAETGLRDLKIGWQDMSAAISRRDIPGICRAYARMESLGDRVRSDVQAELDRLYGSSSPKLEPTTTDPARPAP
jgi:hypothetical protein